MNIDVFYHKQHDSLSHRKQTEHTNTIMREKNRLDMRTTECFMMLRARHFALNMNIVRKERKSEHEHRYNLQSKAHCQSHLYSRYIWMADDKKR